MTDRTVNATLAASLRAVADMELAALGIPAAGSVYGSISNARIAPASPHGVRITNDRPAPAGWDDLTNVR